jgi:nucleotide-binding universal stress UspA family protein
MSSALTKHRHFAVAVDGSEVAHRAFNAALELMGAHDKLTVVHIADDTKDYLARDLTPAGVRETYETELVPRLPEERRDVVIKHKKAGESSKHAMCSFVNSAAVDFFVVGMVGRKGPKADPTVLGSTADYSLRQAHCSSVIVKHNPKKGVPEVFVVGVDGSAAAHIAFETAVEAMNPGDKLVVLHVEDDVHGKAGGREGAHDSAEVEARYAKAVEAVDGASFRTVPKRDGPVSATILEAAEDALVTYLVIGVDGIGAYSRGQKAHFGSTSDRLARMARCSVIVAQRRGATYA